MTQVFGRKVESFKDDGREGREMGGGMAAPGSKIKAESERIIQWVDLF